MSAKLGALGARGKSPAAFDRRCIPPELRCSSLTYLEYARSSRLVSRAPRRSRCYAGFHHGLLALLLALLGLPAGAAAQPDPRQMSGIPLPDAELNDGTVSVRVIRGQLSNNVPNQLVELRHGDVVEEATTDAAGRATFVTLNPGQQVQAATELDGVRIESLPFAAPGRGGVRLMLVGADPDRPVEPAPPGLVTFGGESFIQVEIVEESLEVYYVLEVNNPAQVAVEPAAPVVIELPPGAQGVTVLAGSSPRTAADGGRVELSGPFEPGMTPLRIAYILPYTGESLVIEQAFPIDWESVLLSVEKLGAVDYVSRQVNRRVEVPSETRDGTDYMLGSGLRVAAGAPFTLELTGLPHHSRMPSNVALGIALVILGLGGWGSAATPGTAGADKTRERLLARREALFLDLVKVERQHRDGKIGPTKHRSRRAELFRVLERLYQRIEDEAAAPDPVGTAQG